jgi:hypothetical protein
MVAGKVLMDRNAPEALLDTAARLRRIQGSHRAVARASETTGRCRRPSSRVISVKPTRISALACVSGEEEESHHGSIDH